MKTKTANSPFTPALSKAFKSHKARLICSMTDGAAYVTNGQILVKLTPDEYDEFIRPISRRDPGAWVLDEKGQPIEQQPLDGYKILFDYAGKALSDMTPAPFTHTPEGKASPVCSLYHGAAGDFVAGFDASYTAIFSPSSVVFRASSAVSGLIAFSGEDPVALILPIRIQNPKITAAVRAYFTGGQPQEQPKTDHAAELAAALEEAAKLREELAQTKAQQTAAPAPQPKAEPQNADHLEAVIFSLQSLPGISATVNGAQTSSPVVWIDGDTETHKAELEKLGAKWSFKRSAYYVQIKAA